MRKESRRKESKQQVEERLREFLREGNFRAGDRLPGERELALALGVGRTRLRPAIERLVAEGDLERRPQSGTYFHRAPLPGVCGGTVALIAPLGQPDVHGRWALQVAAAMEERLALAGVRLRRFDQWDLRDDPCSVKTLARQAMEDQVNAVVLIHPLGTREKIGCALAWLHDAGIHPILISSRSGAVLSSTVYFDSEWGAYLATRHLLQLGRRVIGFAGAATGHQWVQDRLQGYRNALGAFEIEPDPAWEWLAEPGERPASQQDGRQAADALLQVEGLSGVVAANDAVALGFWEVCRERGIAVPDQIALVGFDNDPAAAAAGLTTIERPSAAVGAAAARVALERLADQGQRDMLSVRLKPRLIERQSTGASGGAAPVRRERTVAARRK